MDDSRKGFAALRHRINNLAPWQGLALIVVFSTLLTLAASALGR